MKLLQILKHLKPEININKTPTIPAFGQLDSYPADIKTWAENKDGKENPSWRTGMKE